MPPDPSMSTIASISAFAALIWDRRGDFHLKRHLDNVDYNAGSRVLRNIVGI